MKHFIHLMNAYLIQIYIQGIRNLLVMISESDSRRKINARRFYDIFSRIAN